jgi:hypothetical protein
MKSVLQRKLWKVCSEYIKKRDGRVCITCGKEIKIGKGLHVGHFLPSKTCGFNLRYDEDNLAVQCFYENKNLGGFGAMYYVKMVEKHGQEFVDNLFRRYEEHLLNKEKWTDKDYLDKIEYYKKKLH